MRMSRLSGLLKKEFVQLLRDRVMLFLILWLYTIEIVICTLALSFEIKDMPLGVVDADRTPASRMLTEQFTTTDAFSLAGYAESEDQAEAWLQQGLVRVALILPKGLQAALVRNEPTNVQVLLDGTNSNVAAQARAYALQIVGRFEFSYTGAQPPPVQPAIRVWYNPDQTYTSFMVLSMIALAALMVGVIQPAASIVREKEVGTIEQLRVTPIRTSELFVAKTIPTLGLGVLAVFPSLLIAWAFGVPMRGSLTLFVVLTALFLVSAIGIGVLVASVSRTLQQALLLSFFGLFPMMFLSGTLAPVESMPPMLQTLSLISPLRHFMDIILGIFLKGTGIAELWPQIVTLIGIGAALYAIAAINFSRRTA